MATPGERMILLNAVTTDAAGACVHLDDTRDAETRRTGEDLYTSTELLAAEKVLIDAAEARPYGTRLGPRGSARGAPSRSSRIWRPTSARRPWG